MQRPLRVHVSSEGAPLKEPPSESPHLVLPCSGDIDIPLLRAVARPGESVPRMQFRLRLNGGAVCLYLTHRADDSAAPTFYLRVGARTLTSVLRTLAPITGTLGASVDATYSLDGRKASVPVSEWAAFAHGALTFACGDKDEAVPNVGDVAHRYPVRAYDHQGGAASVPGSFDSSFLSITGGDRVS